MRPHAEGQTRPRPNTLKPFTRLTEAFTRRGDKDQRAGLPNQTRQTWINGEQFNVYDPRQDPIVIEELRRVANDRKPPSLIEFKGQMLTGLEYFNALVSLYKRLEQEAEARGDFQIDQSQLPWGKNILPGASLPPLVSPVTTEQRRERNLPYVLQAHKLMAKEAEKEQFVQIAATIPNRIWGTQSSSTLPIAIKPLEQLRLSIKDDGAVVNRSRFGVTLSYQHKDGVLRIPQAADRKSVV